MEFGREGTLQRDYPLSQVFNFSLNTSLTFTLTPEIQSGVRPSANGHDLHPEVRSKHDVILDINDRSLGTFEEYVQAVSKGIFRLSGREMWTSVTMQPLTNEFYIQSPRLQNISIPPLSSAFSKKAS